MKPRPVSAFLFALILIVTLAPPAAQAQSQTPTPPEPQGSVCTLHTVAPGETLAIVAAKYGITTAELARLNNIPNPDKIFTGQSLKVSCAAPEAEPAEEVSTPLASPLRLPDAPRVTGAVSLGCHKVKVFYSESMNGAAEDPANYSIAQAGGDANSRLLITKARFVDGAHTAVELTTLAQDEVRYEVRAVAMRDLTNQPLAPRGVVAGVVIDHSSAVFQGTPPATNDVLDANGKVLIDADGDTLSDTVEQRGWVVHVTLTGGKEVTRRVTSDPAGKDTDLDGISDTDEQAYGIDPRSDDTDGDQLTDRQELEEVYSDPAAQDSDEDGLMDGLELNFFKTSPILADTDGDKFTDDKELFSLDRNPLLADLPRMQIKVGKARLSLNVLSSYTDENGKVKETTESLQTTLGSTKEQKFSTSNTVSNETTLKFGQKVGVEYTHGSKGEGKSLIPSSSVTFSVEATASQQFVNGFTATTDRETAETATKEYQASVARGLTASENRSVTRTAETAEIVAEVSIQNQGDIAFTVSNLELSVLQQDRRKANEFVPVAALRLEGAGDPKEQPSFNLGPFDPQRGPLIFKNTTIFPSLVEQYLREPQGLIYKVVNFDLTDEFGRNFVFSNQDVNDHTAGITIDYGDGTSEVYRVATSNLYDEDGHMQPITMARALEIIGIGRSDDATGDTAGIDPTSPPTKNSYGTQRIKGVEELTRFRGTQTDFASPSPEKRFWAVVTSGPEIPAGQDFSKMELRARDEVQLMFTRDQDNDGLFEREEIYFGSSDKAEDSDGDGLRDPDEVREGWSVTVSGTGIRKVFSSPAMTDSDLDGLTDKEEKDTGTDPTQADSDLDGISDVLELKGSIEIRLFDGDMIEDNNPTLEVKPYQGGPFIENGPNGTCDTVAATGDDTLQRVLDLSKPDFVGCQFGAGPNGSVETRPSGDDFITVAHERLWATDPLNSDTDRDGVTDGREAYLGINPNVQDAGIVVDFDNDGLTDNEEAAGWQLANGTTVKPSSESADSDRDGLPDVFERALLSDPRKKDTDGDKLLDGKEFDPTNPDNIYDEIALAEARLRCADSSDCNYAAPEAGTLGGTDPTKADTDGDGISDRDELTKGWSVNVWNQPTKKVSTNPRVADEDEDGLNDGEERKNKTDPTNPDTDDDGRMDNAEVTNKTDPLRKDYWLTVKLTTVDVIGDCDGDTLKGLELMGQFSLRLPNGTDVILQDQTCYGEGLSCYGLGCCGPNAPGRRCVGQSFTWNKEQRFLLAEDEKFTLFTSIVSDNDDVQDACYTLNNKEKIGSFSKEFRFARDLERYFSQELSSNDYCKIRINYSFTQEK